MRILLFVPVLTLSIFLITIFSADSSAQSTAEWLQKDRSKKSELQHQLTFPQDINITVRQDQVVKVTGGARRFSRPADNIDEILVTKYVGNFECQDKVGTNRPGNYVDTHELVSFWFFGKNNALNASQLQGYSAVTNATDQRDRKLFDSQFFVELCEGAVFPDGEIRTIQIPQFVEMGALCTGDKEDGPLLLEFSLVIYDVVRVGAFNINVTCDNRLTKANRASRRTQDGRFIHRCPEGKHINGTHNVVAFTRTTKPKYCKNSELATKVKKEFSEPGTVPVYEVWCPENHFVKNSDLQNTFSTKPYPPGDYICFPYQYTWTQKKG